MLGRIPQRVSSAFLGRTREPFFMKDHLTTLRSFLPSFLVNISINHHLYGMIKGRCF